MSGKFIITSANTNLSLSGKSQGEASFTVSNSSQRPMRARAKVIPMDNARTEWFAIVGESERSFPAGATQQFTVLTNVPPGTEARKYSFRLDIISDDDPDENFGEGPTVAFEVKPSQPPAKPFPWWAIAAIVAAVLLVGGGVTWLLWPQEKAVADKPPTAADTPPTVADKPSQIKVPSVVGLTLTAAKKAITDAGLEPKIEIDKGQTACGDIVFKQSPAENEMAEPASKVTLVHKTQINIATTVEWLNVRITGVNINGSNRNIATVAPEDNVDIRLNYSIHDPGCPFCIDQIQAGFSHENPITCVYSGIPGLVPKSGDGRFSVKAPNEPGTYFLGVDRSQAKDCVKGWWSGNPGKERYIAAICVKAR